MWGVRAGDTVAHTHQAAPYTVIFKSCHGQCYPHPREHGQQHAHQVGEQACGAAQPLPQRHPRGNAEQDGAAFLTRFSGWEGEEWLKTKFQAKADLIQGI